MTNRILAYLFVSLLSVSGIAQTQTNDTITLGEVTVEANAEIGDLSMLRTQIDSLHISNSMHTDMSEVIGENTAVFIKQSVKGSVAGMSLRGTNSTHTRVSWNKLPLNSPLHGTVDISQLPFLFTDDISINYSAAGMMMNDGALGGSLELSTRPEWNQGINLEYAGAAGSFLSFDNYLKFNWSGNKISYSGRAFHSSSKNTFPYENNDIIDGGTQIRQNADFTTYGLMQGIHYRPSPRHFISLNGWIQSGNRGVPGLSTNESGENNNLSRQNNDKLRAVLAYKWQKKDFVTEAWSGADLQRNGFITRNYISGTGRFISIDSKNRTASVHSGLSARIHLSGKHRIKAMVRHTYQHAHSEEAIKSIRYDASRHDVFFSGSWEYRLSDKWHIHSLVKEDVIEGEFHLPNAAVTVSHKSSKNLSFIGSLSRNMHHPSLSDLHHVPGGNPDLLPEASITADAGMHYTGPGKLKWKHKLNAYVRDITNWIMWRPTPQGYWQPDNIESVKTTGIEYSGNLKKKVGKSQVDVRFSYALNRSVNTSTGASLFSGTEGQIPYIPIHAANFSPTYTWKSWQISYQWNAYSERYTTSNAMPDVLYSIYPYFMSNLHLSHRIVCKKYKLTLTASVYNLFNESYRSVLWQPMPGINFRFGVKFNLL
ncbi:MAG TPA: TonB-dependent receptor plug domain-containing protein [Bacteroidales bacterium]|nr:TonB-dependent receptor plug domain-containing protein [Bacteroidales bacterium]